MRNAKTWISPAILATLTASAVFFVIFQTTTAAQTSPVISGQRPDTLLFVRTTPTGAEIQLDGKKLGTSDGLFPVDPGEYKIVVDLQGHQPLEQNITVRDGRITRIELTLKQSASDAAPGAGRASAGATAQDDKLTEAQRLFRDWTEEHFQNLLNPATPKNKPAQEKLWIEQFNTLEGRATVRAINGLATIGSRKAVPALLKIASERQEKDNQDRWMAVRALGLIGDKSVVPELVHLTYHYNLNTRFWAQISLVRLTGQNFGRDVAAWSQWWKKQGGKPAVSAETVTWTANAEWADRKKQDEFDLQFVERIKGRGEGGQTQRGGVPQIVATSPAVGATEVDPATTEITVTFDRDMGGGFSWTGGGPEYPTVPEGKSVSWRDGRTCVLPVKLEPGRYYRVGINSKSYKNFRSADGMPARPSAIYFATQVASDEIKARVKKPQIVSMSPPNGAKDVDPKLQEIRVTFTVPMGGGFSWTGGGTQFPTVPDGKRPRWSDDHKTCVLPVELKPDYDYRLGLNSPSHKNFQSEGGIPLEPVQYTFSTRGQ